MPTHQHNGHDINGYAPPDILATYIREASRTPLLKRDEEIRLAMLVQQGDARARMYMIKANLLLVIKIARDYEGCGLPLLDLINEGNMGLMEAVGRFIPDRAKFSTYASFWIKQSIRRALGNQARTIRLPVHMADAVTRMTRISSELTRDLGREPIDEELADKLGVTTKKLDQIRRSSLLTPISLDAPIGDSDNNTVADTIADPNTVSPHEQVDKASDADKLAIALRQLDERERTILKLRFGLNGDNDEMTLEEIGGRVGVTRERVRQIQNGALRKLRRTMQRLGTTN